MRHNASHRASASAHVTPLRPRGGPNRSVAAASAAAADSGVFNQQNTDARARQHPAYRPECAATRRERSRTALKSVSVSERDAFAIVDEISSSSVLSSHARARSATAAVTNDALGDGAEPAPFASKTASSDRRPGRANAATAPGEPPTSADRDA